MKIQYISKTDRSKLLGKFADVFVENKIDFIFSNFTDDDILEIYNKQNPDVLLIHHNKKILSTKILKSIKAKKFYWVNDERIPLMNWIVEYKNCIDLFLLASFDSVDLLRKIGGNAEYLIMGIRSQANTDCMRDIPLVFLGQNSENYFPLSKIRKSYINKCIRDINGFVLGGNGWGDKYSGIHKSIYFKAKIGLNIGHQDYKYVYSNRLIEIMAHGAMVLCYRASNLEDIFKEDVHCVYFSDYHELLEKFYYYISNDAARERIAKNGKQYVDNNFTWEHKAKKIIKCLTS